MVNKTKNQQENQFQGRGFLPQGFYFITVPRDSYAVEYLVKNFAVSRHECRVIYDKHYIAISFKSSKFVICTPARDL